MNEIRNFLLHVYWKDHFVVGWIKNRYIRYVNILWQMCDVNHSNIPEYIIYLGTDLLYASLSKNFYCIPQFEIYGNSYYVKCLCNHNT